MSDDLNKDDIKFIIECLTTFENFLLMGFKPEGKDADGLDRKANIVKTKLYRMRDGIDIGQGLKKLESEGGGE